MAGGDRLRRDQKDEQLAGVDGTPDEIVKAFAGGQIFAVEKHLVADRLQPATEVVGDGAIRRCVGQENIHTGHA